MAVNPKLLTEAIIKFLRFMSDAPAPAPMKQPFASRPLLLNETEVVPFDEVFAGTPTKEVVPATPTAEAQIPVVGSRGPGPETSLMDIIDNDFDDPAVYAQILAARKAQGFDSPQPLQIIEDSTSPQAAHNARIIQDEVDELLELIAPGISRNELRRMRNLLATREGSQPANVGEVAKGGFPNMRMRAEARINRNTVKPENINTPPVRVFAEGEGAPKPDELRASGGPRPSDLQTRQAEIATLNAEFPDQQLGDTATFRQVDEGASGLDKRALDRFNLQKSLDEEAKLTSLDALGFNRTDDVSTFSLENKNELINRRSLDEINAAIDESGTYPDPHSTLTDKMIGKLEADRQTLINVIDDKFHNAFAIFEPKKSRLPLDRNQVAGVEEVISDRRFPKEDKYAFAVAKGKMKSKITALRAKFNRIKDGLSNLDDQAQKAQLRIILKELEREIEKLNASARPETVSGRQTGLIEPSPENATRRLPPRIDSRKGGLSAGSQRLLDLMLSEEAGPVQSSRFGTTKGHEETFAQMQFLKAREAAQNLTKQDKAGQAMRDALIARFKGASR